MLYCRDYNVIVLNALLAETPAEIHKIKIQTMCTSEEVCSVCYSTVSQQFPLLGHWNTLAAWEPFSAEVFDARQLYWTTAATLTRRPLLFLSSGKMQNLVFMWRLPSFLEQIFCFFNWELPVKCLPRYRRMTVVHNGWLICGGQIPKCISFLVLWFYEENRIYLKQQVFKKRLKLCYQSSDVLTPRYFLWSGQCILSQCY